ncbi:hypothetical protein NTE_00959 [Candidatus Nitrososphaera evergladensis SR1]|uniref:Uncharacterized protein n=1 Tax=Candidatus Nitrososphaera evergladensis SR1 TaxID=1459636 RepID=A0A075MUQ0_9ARCH|nr:hypothetical protein [Candidatus Nitrososphaera evergladensis]AIF83034.1 hypothetical protein NTE_00959 [Candidatus Nitrososphaera evergladensis SR1]
MPGNSKKAYSSQKMITALLIATVAILSASLFLSSAGIPILQLLAPAFLIERNANAATTMTTAAVEDASSDVPILIGQQPGVSLEDSIAALCCPASIDEIHAQKVIQFTKSGGSQSEGPSPTSLAVTNTVYVNETQTLQFQFFDDVSDDATPSAFHCADIRVVVKVDGETVGVTHWLGYEGRSPPIPLSTGVITLEDISQGKHSLTLIPVTRLGGCNTEGWLYAWGGTLVVFGQS